MSQNLPFYPCGCGSQNNPCEDFPTPTTPDLGICHPKQVQTDCEAPVVPAPECGDDSFVTTYDPNATPPFSILAKLFDQNCGEILDQSGAIITTTI